MRKVTKKTDFKFVFYFIFLLFLMSCAINNSQYIPPQTQMIVAQAKQQGFVFNKYASSLVTYAVWEKMQFTDDDIHIYIEGDGNSWTTKYELSENPTPKKPLSLQLAMRDSHKNVIYIARPCQYLNSFGCYPAYWSHARYSEAVVHSINEVLEQIKSRYRGKRFLLIGFSGGANLAALLSVRRNDILGLITIAGNLDHHTLNRYHQVSILKNSLNAIDYHIPLKNIAQRHFVGSNDRIVPPWLIKQYMHTLNSNCASMRMIKDNTHHQGWVEQWPIHLAEVLPCQVN